MEIQIILIDMQAHGMTIPSNKVQIKIEGARDILKNHLELAKIYMNRLDWLISADDGVESYHTRLKEDLEIYFKNLK